MYDPTTVYDATTEYDATTVNYVKEYMMQPKQSDPEGEYFIIILRVAPNGTLCHANNCEK